MGRRQRQRRRQGEAPEELTAPVSEYADAAGNVLVLRGSMSAATRRAYADVLDGSPLSIEDAWHRAVEFLFERLAVRWVISGVALDGQGALLARLRAASPGERSWIRDVLREHCAAHFPELRAP